MCNAFGNYKNEIRNTEQLRLVMIFIETVTVFVHT